MVDNAERTRRDCPFALAALALTRLSLDLTKLALSMFSASCNKFTLHKASHSSLSGCWKYRAVCFHILSLYFGLLLFPASHHLRRRSLAFLQSSNTVLTQFLLFSQLFTGNLAAAGNSSGNHHVTWLTLGTRTCCRLKEITTTLHIWEVSSLTAKN